MTTSPEATREGLAILARGESLTRPQAQAIFDDIMAGRCDPAQIGALLMGLFYAGYGIASIFLVPFGRRMGPRKSLVVIILLLAIVASLGSGLFYLARDDRNSPRVLKALKIRVALSVILIAFLVVSYLAGWITP